MTIFQVRDVLDVEVRRILAYSFVIDAALFHTLTNIIFKTLFIRMF